MSIFVAIFVVSMASTSIASGESDDMPEEIPDVSGLWSMEMVTTTFSRFAVVGRVETTTTSTLMVEIVQEGSALELTLTTCSIDVETSSSLAQTRMTEAFVNSIEDVVRPGELRPLGEGYELVVPVLWNAQGIRLDDPRSEGLPEDASDPRIVDQDGDGNPGFTVIVDGRISGEIYVIQRGWDEWRGVVENDERVNARLRWWSEHKVLGASRRLLRRQMATEVDDDQSRNYVRMSRVSSRQGC